MSERVRPTSPPPRDDGHLLPFEVWQRVVETADREAERIARGEPALVRHGLTTGLVDLSGSVVARMHGGSRPSPTFGVLHSAETPLAAGYAAAIARMFAATTESKSCHYMTDPAETWGVLDDLLVAWHVGNGNPASIGLEQSGRASMTRAEWLVPAGHAQMTRNAVIIRAARARFGIGAYWMTDQQIRDAHARRIVGGWCTHDDARRVLGGTTHTDPGVGFPRDVQMSLANDGSPTPAPTPVLPPAPSSTGETTMRLVKAAGTPGPVHLITDLETYATGDIRLVDALARAHGIPLVDLNQQQIDLIRSDVLRRRAAVGLGPRTGFASPHATPVAPELELGSPEYLAVLDDVLEFSHALLPRVTA